ncbi:SdpI family protein [Asticcacaulis sp.]|uniref:SdpI family protein n=1 Tax=Asticcacaulis sp. TaxID=1872648 RepID=UPI002BBFFDEB|nr:SdpI family protein [Asticcacaulis sp.]HTM80109.1 SdpI family protein [Asticcacaulis sp.]
MQLRSEKILCLILFAVMAGFAVWGRFNLPDVPVAVHFGPDGQPNGYQPRDMAMVLMPAITFATLISCLWILPRLLPKSASLERSQTVYGIIVLAVTALLVVCFAGIVMTAAGNAPDTLKIVLVGTGLLFILIGNYMPKMRRNWVMGIRTPWTLADERVWDKTHRFAGPLFMLSGLVTTGGALLAPVDWRVAILMFATLSVCCASYIYSWAAARRLR